MPKEISLKDIDQLNNAFSRLNLARRISKNEFIKLLKSERIRLNDCEIQLLFFLVEPDQNGCIDFIEFLTQLGDDYTVTNENIFLRNLFSYLDRNGNGSIDFNEFKKIADIFDDYIREDELKEYFDEVDINEDGMLSFDEFEQNRSLQLMNNFFRKLIYDIDPAVKEIFDYLDTDKDGYLSYEEFKLLSDIEDFKEMDEIDFRECFDEIDRDKDGRINFKEFSEIVDDEDDDDTDEEDDEEFVEYKKEQNSEKTNSNLKEKNKRFSLTPVEESPDF